MNAYHFKCQTFRHYFPSIMCHIVFKYFVILLIFFVNPCPANSFTKDSPQKPLRFEHISIEDGLSYPNVYGIFQDQRGFLWFATKYGLNRYDGMECTVYTHNPDNPKSLSNNFTWFIFEDSGGNLWVVTYGGGLSIFNPKTESFKYFCHEPDNPYSLSNDFAWYIFEDSRKQMWVGTDGGLNSFDSTTETFSHYIHDPDNPNSLSHNVVTMITEDKNGFLWISTFGGGLNRFDPKTKDFIHFKYHSKQLTSISDNKIHFVFIDSKDSMWTGTEKGLNKLFMSSYLKPIPKNDFIHYYHNPNDSDSLPHNRVRSIYEDKNANLWFATSGGLSQHNRQKNKFISYESESNNPNSLSHNSLYYVFGDQKGTLWIGTANGVDKLDPGNQQFDLYLSGSHIHSIYEISNGDFMIGTNNGLKNINRYHKNADIYEFLSKFNETIVTKIESDNEGRIWIASLGEGLYSFDPQKKSYKHYQHNQNNTNSLSSNIILDLAVSRDNIIWIALSNNGIDKFDPKQNTFKHYTHKTDNENSLISNWTRNILIDSNKMIWVGTEGGLSRLNPENNSFTNFCYKRNNPDSLSDNIVNMIIEDSNKNIWIATNGGLNQLNLVSNNFTVYRKKNGLPGDSIAAIIEDNSGHLWVSTNNGLSKFDPTRKTFKNYDQLDGLQGKQFIFHSAYKSRDGKLYFGGTNGLNAFYPEKLMDNQTIPKVYLTDFRLFNKSVPIGDDSPLQQHISFTQNIVLSYKQNVFSFDFVALNYRASKKNQYAYMLKGIDKDWIFTDSKHRTAKYTNINPGSYVFRVKASNNDGIWNEKGIAITISILPAFWMTWWFKSIIIICFIGCGIGTYYWRLRAIKFRNIKLERLIEERTKELQKAKKRAEASDKAKSRFIANMSHEFRTPLNIILGYTKFLIKDNLMKTEQVDDLNVIHKSGEHLLTLINDILDLAKIEADKLKIYPTQVSLSNFLDNIVLMIKLAAHQKKIEFIFEPSSNLPSVIKIDAKRLRQVLLNLLGNAVKFTKKGYIKFEVESKKGLNNKRIIEFKIHDTGIGIQADKLSTIFKPFEQVRHIEKYTEGTGLGLSISRQLVDLMGGSIQVKSEVGKGTSFIVHISVSETTQEVSDIQKELKTKMIHAKSKKNSESAEIIPPPLEELNKLYDLARFGNMELIQKQARYIEQLDKKYIPFATKIKHLATEYEDESIVSFVKLCMDNIGAWP